jgi:hypothetical protein
MSLLAILVFTAARDGGHWYHTITCKRVSALPEVEVDEMTNAEVAAARPAACCKPSERLLAPYLTTVAT